MDVDYTEAQGGQANAQAQGGQDNYQAQDNQINVQAQGGQNIEQAQSGQYNAHAQGGQENASGQGNQDNVQVHSCQDTIQELVDLMNDLDFFRTITAKTYLEVVKGIRYKRLTPHQFFKLSKTEPMQKFYTSLEEVEGDLFTADPSWALAHCVSKDMAMFRGIAVTFKDKFNHVEDLLRQGAGVGYVAVLHHVGSEDEECHGRFIFYMVTKILYYHKPSYFHVYSALERLKTICKALNVTKIAMPRIASGCDRMNYDVIKHILHLVFYKSDIAIRIYSGENLNN